MGLTALIDARTPPDNERVAAKMEAWWQRNESVWVSAFADVPAAALKTAFSRALVTRFLKTPADIMKFVEEEMGEQRTALARLKIARDVALRQRKREADAPPPCKDMVGIKEMMAEVYRKLGAGIPGDDDGKSGDTKTGRAA